MKSIGNHTDHLAWVTRILSSPKDFCEMSVRYAKQVAEERDMPIFQQFIKEEAGHA